MLGLGLRLGLGLGLGLGLRSGLGLGLELLHAPQSTATQPAHAPHRRRLPPPPDVVAALRGQAFAAPTLAVTGGGACGPHSAVCRGVVRTPGVAWLEFGFGFGLG